MVCQLPVTLNRVAPTAYFSLADHDNVTCGRNELSAGGGVALTVSAPAHEI